MSLTGKQQTLLEKMFGPQFGENAPTTTPKTAQPGYLTTVLNNARNQNNINQLRGTAQANSTATGIPKHVFNVNAQIAPASAGMTSAVTVTFQQDPSDRTFSGVLVYAKGYQGNPNPVQVASGSSSPVQFIVNNTGESLSVSVQAVGNSGKAPIATAPICGVKLPQSALGGVGKTTQTNANNLAQLPGTLDNIKDGTSYAKPIIGRINAGRPVIDFSEAIHSNKIIDNIADGSTYARSLATRISSGKPLIDFSESIHLNKNVDNVADGTTYLRPTFVSGDAIIENGNFEASSTILPPPGYQIYANTPTLAYDTSTQYSGARSLQITSSALGTSGVAPLKKTMCRPGDVVYASVRAKVVSGAGTAKLAISFRDGTGSGIGGADTPTSSTSWVLLSNTLTAPAGTVYATFELHVDTAGTVVEFDEHYVRLVRSLDTEVSDGSTYGRTLQTALTSGAVDPTKSGVLMKGSVPPSLSALSLNGMTWSTAPTSVTFAWNPTSIYRADGTATSVIAAGTQAVTGLVASQNYTAYPYYDEPTSTLKWVGSELVFPTIASVGLNGSSQYVTTSASVLSLPTAFTLECWVKTTSATAQALISLFSPQTGTGAATHQDMELVIGSTGELTFAYVNASSVIKTVTTSGAGLLDGAWHHIVVSFATGGTVTIYVDTVSVGTGSALGAPRNAGFSLWYHIGFVPFATGWPISATNAFLNGSISNVAIYAASTALTAAQVSNHFITGINLGFGASAYPAVMSADNPTYFWKLNETSGTSAADSAGTNTGTYQGSPTLNQQASVVVPAGSPAYMWPYKNFLCSQAQSLQSRIPLSNGSLTPSTPASGSGSGGGGGVGGGGKGGCWSGNTLVKTPNGPVRIDEWVDGTLVLTAAGTWTPATLKKHESRRWKMIDPMSNGELVTLTHNVLTGTGWKKAHMTFADKQTCIIEDHVYDLAVNVDESNEQMLSAMTEHSYTLESGIVAHNVLPK